MDETLTWDPADYEDINMTFVPVSAIWRPRIAIQNRYAFILFPAKVVIQYSVYINQGFPVEDMYRPIMIPCLIVGLHENIE